MIEIKGKFILHGGRGSSSGNGAGTGGSLFGGQNGGNEPDHTRSINPSIINSEMGGKDRSYEMALAKFVTLYKDSNREWAMSLDDDGFAHSLVRGNRGSVLSDRRAGQMVIHNHPSDGYGNFSAKDLENAARLNTKGIVAVGREDGIVHSFVKTARFNADGFLMAMKKAKMNPNKGYNENVADFLRKNAKKFGYKYTETKIDSYNFKTKLGRTVK